MEAAFYGNRGADNIRTQWTKPSWESVTGSGKESKRVWKSFGDVCFMYRVSIVYVSCI